jgi:transposase
MPAGYKLTEAKLSECIKMYDYGYSIPTIAERFGLHTDTIRRGIKLHRKLRSKSERKIIFSI